MGKGGEDDVDEIGTTVRKARQNLANRPDLVPEDVMEELTSLQDKAPAFPNVEAQDIMETQWGEKIDDVFETFTKEPVAARPSDKCTAGR